MKLIWLTDIHLNFLTLENRMEFYQKVIAASNAISDHRPKKVIILIHVPPFKEVCLHEGKKLAEREGFEPSVRG
jgi:hypothetical protein